MFVDEAVVQLKAGDGGRGCVSFRREKFEPMGGPNGGDGGRGGNVILLADHDVNSLTAYRFKKRWQAGRGEHGRGSDQHGRTGQECILRVPPGTLVLEEETRNVIAEVLQHGEQVVICRGGNGGWGNARFKTSTNRAPRNANPGHPGETGTYRLILKCIADAGLVGYPNAGKSSLMRQLTMARPRTAAYPFTTLHPQIGIMEDPDTYRRMQIADVPGLIAGASENKGLGHRFLRHIERCSLLVILLDMAGTDGRHPLEDYHSLQDELGKYNPDLLDLPIIIAANKMDLPEAASLLSEFRNNTSSTVIPISCLTGEGLPELRNTLFEVWERGRKPPPASPAPQNQDDD